MSRRTAAAAITGGYSRRRARTINVDPACLRPTIDPTFEYDHGMGSSITGGFVYRGRRMRSRFAGRYFYADFVRGRVWSLGLSVNGTTGRSTAANLIEHTAELGSAGSHQLLRT